MWRTQTKGGSPQNTTLSLLIAHTNWDNLKGHDKSSSRALPCLVWTPDPSPDYAMPTRQATDFFNKLCWVPKVYDISEVCRTFLVPLEFLFEVVLLITPCSHCSSWSHSQTTGSVAWERDHPISHIQHCLGLVSIIARTSKRKV